MCFGPELLLAAAGAAASGVGSIISQNEAASDAATRANARNDELRQSLARQKDFASQARALFDTRRDAMAQPNQAQALGEAQTKRADTLVEQVKQPETTDVTYSGSAPSVVKSELAKRMLSAMEESKAKAQAMGKLGGYDQQWFGNALGNAQIGRQIGTINNFSRSEAGMLPALQDLAEASVAKPPSGIGGILQGLGSAAGSIAGGGNLKGWMS